MHLPRLYKHSQRTDASSRNQEPDEYRTETFLDALPTSSMFNPNTELADLKLTLNTQASPISFQLIKDSFESSQQVCVVAYLISMHINAFKV